VNVKLAGVASATVFLKNDAATGGSDSTTIFYCVHHADFLLLHIIDEYFQ
jgi:hypothetical protein